MSSVTVTCIHCGFTKDVPAAKIPDREVQVNCPKCRKTFPFTKPRIKAVQSSKAPQPLKVEEAQPPVPTPPLIGNTAPRPSGTGPEKAPLPPAEEMASRQAPLAVLLGLFLALLAGLWWLNCPAANPASDGSFSDSKGAFAIKAPSQWVQISPDNFSALMDQYRDRIPKELFRMFGRGKPPFTVSYFHIPAKETEFSSNFNVIVLDTKGRNLPRLTESEKKNAVEKASHMLAATLAGYRVKESSIVQVDGLDCLQIVGEAEFSAPARAAEPGNTAAFGRNFISGRHDDDTQKHLIRCIQTMIPGKKRAYMLSFMYDDTRAPEMGSVHRQVLESFRVLERPPRFGSIAMGALNGGLIGAAAYLAAIAAARLLVGIRANR